jgi:putative transcriptional regulator
MALKEKLQEQQALYHYRECGLDNICLVNGVRYKSSTKGVRIHIDDLEGLHLAIGRMLISEKKRLNGRDLRFLRHELNLTQEHLAALLYTDVQSIARWEKGKTKVPGPADRLIRLLYKERVNGNEGICEPLRKLAELDEMTNEDESPMVMFAESSQGWEVTNFAA